MKITSHQQFMEDLAVATIALFERGKFAPTAPEIAGEYWTNGFAKFQLTEVRNRLGEIRRKLHSLGYSVVPVSDEYYENRSEKVLTEALVKECLAMGRGKSETGILLVREDDTLAKWIKVSHERWSRRSADGKVSAANDRLEVALDQGLITQGEFIAITGTEDRLQIES